MGRLPSGERLRLARLKARLRQADVAAQLGCSRSRVSQIEALGRVSPDWAARYGVALEQLADASRSALAGAPRANTQPLSPVRCGTGRNSDRRAVDDRPPMSDKGGPA
jgi:DNA-binding XRE family transcriptional regulator